MEAGLGTRPRRFRCSKSCSGTWHLPAPLGLNQEDPKGFLCAGIHAPEPLPPSSSQLCQRTQSRLCSVSAASSRKPSLPHSQLSDPGSALWDLDGNLSLGGFKSEPVPHSCSSPTPQARGSASLLVVSVEFPLLGVSCRWRCTPCCPLTASVSQVPPS